MTYGGKGFWEVIGKLGIDAVAGQIKTALDAGVNFIDTANVYHESENLLGQAIKKLGVARDTLVIATKVLGRTSQDPNGAGLSRKHIFEQVDVSLKRMGLDYIASRDIERELVPLCREEGLGIMPWSPLGGGLLSGKFDFTAGKGAEGTRRATFDFPVIDKSRAEQCVEAMRPVATEHGVSVAQIALVYLLAKPGVTSVIIGAKTDEQLKDNLAAANVRLTADQLAKLDEVSALPLE
ncbi:hypothetical protein BH11MYX2_BH11MYX2_13990 [soil metagenome]